MNLVSACFVSLLQDESGLVVLCSDFWHSVVSLRRGATRPVKCLGHSHPDLLLRTESHGGNWCFQGHEQFRLLPYWKSISSVSLIHEFVATVRLGTFHSEYHHVLMPDRTLSSSRCGLRLHFSKILCRSCVFIEVKSIIWVVLNKLYILLVNQLLSGCVHTRRRVRGEPVFTFRVVPAILNIKHEGMQLLQ